jgi:hypothetical protein
MTTINKLWCVAAGNAPKALKGRKSPYSRFEAGNGTIKSR